jgi:hypothetical protein
MGSNFKRLFFIAACLLMVKKAWTQDLPKQLFSASNIPDSLKEDANSVVRYSLQDMKVEGPGKLTIKVHSIVTILNEKGDGEAEMVLYYNKKYDTYSDVVMRVYDANGGVIKKYHKGDMNDYSATADADLISDERVLAVKHTVVSYPTTIEIEYEENISSAFDLNSWDIQGNEQSVQNEYCHISIDANAGFRYLNKNTSVKPEMKSADGRNEYSWSVANLKAIKKEEGAEPWRVFPHIYFAAAKFNKEGYPGDISTWENFAKWQKALNDDGSSLSPEREAEIRKMTDTIKTDKAKAMFLYNYMQQNVRYVSVQLGIGGWKPFPATFVDQKKYGDCKALSNYMGALLKAVGIPSYYAIINAEANKEPADPSFPFNYFNHVIRCIPFKGDTTWLECTTNTDRFGKLGAFTENRNALIVTEDGGKLVSTPKSHAEDNQINSLTHLILDEDGGAKGEVKISSTGEIRALFVAELPGYNSDKQKEAILRIFDIKQPAAFDFKSGDDINGVKEVNLNLDFDKYCDIKAGDKLFYHPQALNCWDYKVPVFEKRKSDYYFDFPFEGVSTTVIYLPAGFEVETLPVNQSLKFTYGDFEVKYTYDEAKNQVLSVAKFNLNNQLIPAAKYTEMQEYLDAVAKVQNKKLVIKRKA